MSEWKLVLNRLEAYVEALNLWPFRLRQNAAGVHQNITFIREFLASFHLFEFHLPCAAFGIPGDAFCS